MKTIHPPRRFAEPHPGKWPGCFVVLLLLAASCAPKLTTTSSHEVKDSVRVEYVPREVRVEVPGDTVEIIGTINCDSLTNKPRPASFKARSKRATVSVTVSATGRLEATAACDSMQLKITALDKEIFHLRHEVDKKTVVQTEYKTRTIDKICRWISAAVVLALAGFIVGKIYRII